MSARFTEGQTFGRRLLARPWIPYLVVAIAAFAVYSNTLRNGWVLDDFPQILQNPWITSPHYAGEILSNNAWAFDARDSSYYRPAIQIIYMMIYYFFGLKPFAFHLANVLIHAGICILVLATILRLSEEVRPGRPAVIPGVIAAILFATHPIHTEVVAPVMGMHDLAFTSCYLLSFFLYTVAKGRWNAPYVGSVWAFFAALLCKEPAATLPLLLVAFDALIRRERVLAAAALKRYAPYGGVIAVYLAMRYHALGGLLQNQYAQAELSTYGYVINVFPLLVRYLGKLLVPVNLSLVYLFAPIESLFEPRAILALLMTGVVVVLVWRVAGKDRLAALACVFLFLPLLPALYLPGLNQRIQYAFAERYLYLPSVGFVILAFRLLQWRAGENLSRIRTLAPAVATSVIVLFSIGTLLRNSDWKDNYSLWSDAVRKTPNSAIAHKNLGYAFLYGNRDPSQAKAHFETALKLDPDLADDEIRAGVAYAGNGMIDKAIFQFHAALVLRPDSGPAHYNLALAYEDKGWQQNAVGEYETAIRLDPRNANAHNNVGILYARNGSPEKALQHFETAAMLRPSDPEFAANLLRARTQLVPAAARVH